MIYKNSQKKNNENQTISEERKHYSINDMLISDEDLHENSKEKIELEDFKNSSDFKAYNYEPGYDIKK